MKLSVNKDEVEEQRFKLQAGERMELSVRKDEKEDQPSI